VCFRENLLIIGFWIDKIIRQPSNMTSNNKRSPWVVSSNKERKKLGNSESDWNLPGGVFTDGNGRRARTVQAPHPLPAATSNDSSSIDDSSFSCPESSIDEGSADEELLLIWKT
jgi:hypothetical protein